MPNFIIQHMAAPNDVNGNPRRAFAVYDTLSGHLVAAFDEGYHGTRAVPSYVWDGGTFIGRVTVPAKEYRRVLNINNWNGYQDPRHKGRRGSRMDAIRSLWKDR